MEPPTGGLAHLEQYGALGIIASALLMLVVLLVKRFVDHAIESNKQLQLQNSEMQKENLKAMHAMVSEIAKLRSEIVHEFHIGIASVLNSDVTVIREREPRERRQTRPPLGPRGSSSGGSGGG